MTKPQQPAAKHYGLVFQSVLNGLVGDYLNDSANPLAIQMGIYHRSKPIDLSEDIGAQLGGVSLCNKVLVLVHGLTNLETIWDFRKSTGSGKPSETAEQGANPVESAAENPTESLAENYGSHLQREFGYTALFVRYNTGLAIEDNGRQLARLLQDLYASYPIDIDELMLMGFSMGGLLIRYAQQEALQQNAPWLQALKKCVYLGTPHEGSPLEKAGDAATELLRNIPFEPISHWAEWADLRSQGIKDLRVGLAADPKLNFQAYEAGFLETAEHLFISGSVAKRHDSLMGKLLGDTLVRQTSAVPYSRPAGSQIMRFEKLAHIPLAHSWAVYSCIREWVAERQGHCELKSLPACEVAMPSPAAKNHLTTFAALEVVSDTATKVIDSTEFMHRSISDIPFGLLRRVPLISPVSTSVETLHKSISDLVYRTLKKGSEQTKRFAHARRV